MSTNHTSPAPTSDIPHPTSALPHPTSLSQPDKARLTILYRARGDATSLVSLCGEDNPLDLLAWLNEPHIKPWHQAILAAHNQHLHTDTQLSLAHALKDITRILDLEADSTLRIRAVNNIIRLANAIHRAGSSLLPPGRRAGVGLAKSRAQETTRAHLPLPEEGGRGVGSQTLSTSENSYQPHTSHRSPRAAKELHAAQERVEDSKSSLSLHLDRRARNKTDLEDVNAPVGTFPSWALPLPAEGRAGVRLADIPSTTAHHNPESKLANQKSNAETPRAP